MYFMFAVRLKLPCIDLFWNYDAGGGTCVAVHVRQRDLKEEYSSALVDSMKYSCSLL